jgi:hypothetical protein
MAVKVAQRSRGGGGGGGNPLGGGRAAKSHGEEIVAIIYYILLTYYCCEFSHTGRSIGARNITQCRRFPNFTPILPHLRCGGIDAAPHPHGLPAKVG